MQKNKLVDKAILAVSAAFFAFHIYTAYFGALGRNGQRPVHLALLLVVFFLSELQKPGRKMIWKALDIALMLGCVASLIYPIVIFKELQLRLGLVYPLDMVFGTILIAGLLVVTSRLVGKSLAIVSFCFILYGFFGKYMPGFFGHAGFTYKKFINLVYISTDGIFGTALYASSWYIALFIILGALMQESGIGDYFTGLAMSAFGRVRGGPAKVAVLASGLFGSISGSAIANVVATGTFTIPMMKRCGFEDDFAGGVEAAASTGGQIMPPVMGATAFLVADMLGIPYIQVAGAALIPAVLFYVAIFMTVDLYAKKHNIKGSADEFPSVRSQLRRVYLFIPLIFLVCLLMFTNLTITRAGLYTNILTVAVVMLSAETRLNWTKIKRVFLATAKGTMPVAVACATVGIITGVVMGSGLGNRISAGLINLANGSQIVLLILTMIVSLILGMGLPTTAAYLVLAVLVVPALTRMGVSNLAAHLFILYFGIISGVTPPVALSAYAAAGVAGSNPTKTGFEAFKLSLSGFILPFLWVYSSELLGQGVWYHVIFAVVTALIGTYCLSCVVQKYFWAWNVSWPEVLLLLGSALALLVPGTLTDLLGVAVLIGLYCYHRFLDKARFAPTA